MPTPVFINEIHYDNVGTDSGEFIEVAGLAGTDLTGWSIVFYNGNVPGAATVYRTLALTGTIDNEGSGYGALSFSLPVDGIQNGPTDGFALVNNLGQVIQFLSYEGTITASGGAASGMTSTSIGVEEGTATPVGSSLRLTGTGTNYEDFTWSAPAANSAGSINQGQSFGAAPQPGELAIADASLAEGQSGTTNFTFTVNRAGGSAGAVSATYTVTLGTASADDFGAPQPITGTVSFADGETTATITIAVQGDTAIESDENFTVTLSAPTGGATLADAVATGTIVNDDFPAVTGTAFINEILYNPSGADTNEAVEIAGTAGLNLSGWKLVLYNGNGGASYSTVNLSGVIDDEDDGFGALSFATPGIQNGDPDGIALVNASNEVVQFISYGGTMTAANGPAAGLTSDDIGVTQTGSEPNTLSLQLKGSGNQYEDFGWASASTSSFGSLNSGQDLTAVNPNGSFRIGNASVTEGDSGTTDMVFTVARTGGTAGSVTVNYTVTFGSGIGAANGADLTGTLSGTVTFADGDASETITIQVLGDTAGEPDESFTVTLSDATGGANVSDGTGTGLILNDDVVNARIYEIQGAGHRSAFEGVAVTTTGIVTAVASNGFYLQDATGDGDATTSDGIFVFTNTAPPPSVVVGNELSITGEVAEFLPGGDAASLSITELLPTSITLLSAGNALPAAVLIGPDGIAPPTEVLEDDGFTSFDPATDGLDFYETLEGMLVTVQSPVAVAPSTDFGEIWTVASRNGTNLLATNVSEDGYVVIDGGAGGLGVVNQGAGSDFNPERILIDQLVGDGPAVVAGTVLESVTGVVNYSFGYYRVLATSAVTVDEVPLITEENTMLTGSDYQLTIATYNVLNLDPNDSDGDTDVASGRFDAIAYDIATNLALPDIIVLEEVQDNDGSTNSGTVSSSLTLQMLSDAIFAESGVRYSWQENPFITDGENGGEPGGNISVAFLYREDRVDLDESSVRPVTDPVDQANNASNPFAGARLPLVADFFFDGETVTVIGNHFTSKGGSGPLGGAVQPSVAGGEIKRAQQADLVNAYVESILAGNAGAKVVVAGDLNEFQFEEPLRVLTGELDYAGGVVSPGSSIELENLTYLLDRNERYSYVFEGNAQQIDHILVSGALSGGAAIDVLHINRDEFASDHDPVLARLNVGAVVTTQTGTGGTETLTGAGGRDRLEGLDGNDRLRGFAGNDILVGGSGDDTMEGGAGDDRMAGGTGDDSYIVDSLGDEVIELPGEGYDTVKTVLTSYTLGANVEVLQFTSGLDSTGTGNGLGNGLFGGAGLDTLYGLDGNDRLVGGGGDDVLVGGAGRDTLEGGAGADRFVFATGDFATVAKPDTIKDFDTGSGDVIDLSSIGGMDFVGTAAFSGTAGEVRYQQIGGNTFVYGDIDGDGVADFAIQLVGALTLSDDDFLP